MKDKSFTDVFGLIHLSPALKVSVFLLVSLTISSFAYSQDYLVLEKMGTKKRYVFYVDDPITFKIKETGFNTDVIVALTDSTIVFAGGSVPLKEIVGVSLKGLNEWVTASGITLMIAGFGYLIIDQFNNSVIQGNGISTDDGVIKTSAILAGIGFLMYTLARKNVNTAKNWRLRYVNIF